MSWRYILTRFDGDGNEVTVDTALPVSSPSLVRTLSGPRQASFTVPIELARLRQADGTPTLQRWGSGVYAEDETGRIRGGGILVNFDISPDGELALDVAGPSAYLNDMPYTDSTYWIEEDPLNIYRAAWAHVQSQPGGNMGVLIDDTTSPVRIGTQLENVDFVTGEGERVQFEAGPYKLNWYTTDNLASNMNALAKETPFDYLETTYWEGERIRHRIELGYPQIGERREQLRLVLGENVFATPSRKFGGDGVASEVLVLGSGEGRDKNRGYATGQRQGHLRRVLQVDDKELRSVAAAQARAAAVLDSVQRPASGISQLTVVDHQFARLGSFDVGDEIPFAGRSSWQDIDTWARVLKITENPENPGALVLDVDVPGNVAA